MTCLGNRMKQNTSDVKTRDKINTIIDVFEIPDRPKIHIPPATQQFQRLSSFILDPLYDAALQIQEAKTPKTEGKFKDL